MRFLFVDQITGMEPTTIRGRTTFSKDHPLQYANPYGGQQIAPGVISEAVGQLVSWLEIKNNDFTGRPVFLFADQIEIIKPVAPGATLEMNGRIEQSDQESFVFSGEASVDGELVHRVHQCSGYNMPLENMEDPSVTRQRFQDLTNQGLTLKDSGDSFNFEVLSGETTDLAINERIKMAHSISENAPFYADHFPRFPVTPIVMINEMIGIATAKCLGKSTGQLFPRSVSGVKIKNFLAPNEPCEVTVTIKEVQPATKSSCGGISTVAEITKDGKKILRGRYKYDLVENV